MIDREAKLDDTVKKRFASPDIPMLVTPKALRSFPKKPETQLSIHFSLTERMTLFSDPIRENKEKINNAQKVKSDLLAEQNKNLEEKKLDLVSGLSKELVRSRYSQ